MIAIMIVFVSLGSLVCLCNHNKLNGIALLIIMMIIMVGVDECRDYDNYESLYKSLIYFNPYDLNYENAIYYGYSTDYGYSLFSYCFYNLGISYGAFRSISTVIFLLILYFTIRKITDNTYWVFWGYFLSVFIMDIIQVRNFMAEVILLGGFIFYAIDEKHGGKKFLICDILASGFHSSFLLYIIVFVLVDLKMKKRFGLFFKTAICMGVAMPLYERGIINNISTDYIVFFQDSFIGMYQHYLNANLVNLGYLVSYAKFIIL